MVAKAANDDTFHYTNSAPQHHGFNAGATLWGGLEDYILNNAEAQDYRVTVFSGPILRANDPRYRGIKLPLQFWKVVVMLRDDGRLSATAFRLSQAKYVSDLEDEEAAFSPDEYQIMVREVEELTGLDFGRLKDYDPLDGAESFTEGEESAGVRTIKSYADIKF